jgi:hypothetical protein
MEGKITRVAHRHSDQKKGDADLVLEVGNPLPPFYQEGRRAGLRVRSIEASNPLKCILDDGDIIYIGEHHVRAVARRAPDA